MKYDPDKKYYPDDVLEFDSEEAFEEAVKAKAQEFADDVDSIVTDMLLYGITMQEAVQRRALSK